MKESNLQEAKFIKYLESCKGLIIKVARVYCYDAEDRKDLTQDIILQLWKSFPKYDVTYAITTWTYRIALNVSISFLRKTKKRHSTHADYVQHFEIFNFEDVAPDEKLEHIYKFIEGLKSIDKAIMILFMEGCKNKEISAVTGMTDSNISTRKERVKNKLKKYFETQQKHYNEI